MSEPPVKKKKVESPLKESDVGISERVNSAPRFNGLLKERYTDFQVNEITKDGVVVRLSVPLPEASPEPEKPTEPEKPNIPELDESLKKKAEEILGETFVSGCLKLFLPPQENPPIRVITEKTFNDKSERTEVHELIRELFKGRLDSNMEKDARISAAPMTPKKKNKDKAGGKFLHITVLKENKETMEVASLLAKLIHLKPRDVTFAGTKDRRGITTQRFALAHTTIGRATRLNSQLRGAKIGNFVYTDEPLRLGDLGGNEFWITLRDVTGTPEEIEECFSGLKNNGFINYFGLQRFGTFSTSSHELGRCILSGDYDSCVSKLLSPQDVTNPESREARNVWAETHDPAKALQLMPRRCAAEYAILAALKDSPSSINAILRVPRNLRVMYVHAYQSYIWNCAASARIKMGLTIQDGDLVIDEESEDQFERARPANSEKDTIFDIVLPTPGFDIEYPSNLLKVYEDIMGSDGIDCHSMRRNIREFSLSGSYRPLLAKPTNVEWWMKNYSNQEEDIVSSDRDVLRGQSKIIDTNGERRAAVLKMSLGPSQYATMALREVLQ